MLIDREGLVLHEYKDSAGYPTIGVGHLLTAIEKARGTLKIGDGFVPYAKGITAEQAVTLLQQDLAWAERAVLQVTVPLADHQFDCLVSFVFNVGAAAFAGSTLRRLLNESNYKSVPTQLRRWVKAGGKRSRGLVSRRASECQQWLTPYEEA